MIKKLGKKFREMSIGKKIEFIGAILLLIIFLIIGISYIGWYNVFTSVCIGIVYDDIKELINKIKEDDK